MTGGSRVYGFRAARQALSLYRFSCTLVVPNNGRNGGILNFQTDHIVL
jgi:hypothetical protein